MRVLLDMDGVCASFASSALELHGLPSPYDTEDRGEHLCNLPELVGLTDEEFWPSLGREFWAHLPLTEECDQIVSLVSRFVGHENICFFTSPCATEGCIEGKRDWRDRYYSDIPMLMLLSAENAAPPKHFCAGPGTILIDDSAVNVRNFVDGGGHAFLVPRPWNQDHRYESQLVDRLQEYLQKHVG